MVKIETLFKFIGETETLNAILVMSNVRPAFLIQPSDYKVKKVSKLLNNISKYFPSLYHLETNWGIFISKKKLNIDNIKSNSDVGKIIGYLCSDTYDDVISNSNTKKHVYYSIFASLKNGSNAQLFATVCPDKSSREKFEKLKSRVEKCLLNNTLTSPVISSISLDEVEIIPPSIIIEKLYSNKPLNEEEKSTIQNIFFNYGFTFEIQIYDFDYSDSFHRGVMATMILYYMHNVLEPFMPFSKYPKETAVSEKIIYDLEHSILNMLIKYDELKIKRKNQSI
jgi:hypothetical protein